MLGRNYVKHFCDTVLEHVLQSALYCCVLLSGTSVKICM